MVINRDFAEKHGLNNAVIFGNLCSMASNNNNYFYFKIEDLAKSTTLCSDTIKKGLAYLSSKGYITKERKGIPSKNWFSINEDTLEREVSTDKLVEKSTDCKVENNTDYINSNKEKEYIYTSLLEKWNTLGLVKHTENVVESKWKKKHTDQVTLYGKDKVFKAMENYATIIHSPSYFFDYKWPLWDFIARGLDKFVDDVDPFTNFKCKKIESKNTDQYAELNL